MTFSSFKNQSSSIEGSVSSVQIHVGADQVFDLFN